MKALHKKQRGFLAAYALTASITKAAEAVKIERRTHYHWIAKDAGYMDAFHAAGVDAAQTLEDEAVRRAHEGVLVPVFHQGKPVGVIREYSDALLLALLKAFRPAKYRDRASVEISGPAGGPISLEQQRLAVLTDDELAGLIAAAQKLDAAARDASGADAPRAA